MSIASWECVASWYFDGEVPDWSAADESVECSAYHAAAHYAEQHDTDGVLATGGTVLVYVRPYGSERPVVVFEVCAEAQLVYSASRVQPAKGVA